MQVLVRTPVGRLPRRGREGGGTTGARDARATGAAGRLPRPERPVRRRCGRGRGDRSHRVPLVAPLGPAGHQGLRAARHDRSRRARVHRGRRAQRHVPRPQGEHGPADPPRLTSMPSIPSMPLRPAPAPIRGSTRTDTMNHRVGLRLLAALLPAAALLPGAAHAEKVVTEDPVGDAHSLTIDWEGGAPSAFVPAPDETSVDVVRTVASPWREASEGHRAGSRPPRRATSGDLPRRGGRHPGPFLTALELSKVPGHRLSTMTSGAAGETWSTVARPCGAGWIARRTRLEVSLPTACLGTPRWVRLGVQVRGFDLPARTRGRAGDDLRRRRSSRHVQREQQPARGRGSAAADALTGASSTITS